VSLSARKFFLGGLVALCGVVGGLGLGVSSAFAERPYVLERTFGGSGSGAGQMLLRAAVGQYGVTSVAGSGVAVDDDPSSPAYRDVYVADTENHRVDEFNADGAFVRSWGWGVENGNSEFQACTASTKCQAGIAGTGLGEFEAPSFIAVDDSTGPSGGDVYVGDTGDDLVTKFGPEGELEKGWGVGGQLSGPSATHSFGELAGVAVDSSGTLDVLKESYKEAILHVMFQFDNDGVFRDEFHTPESDSEPDGLAVNAAGDFFKEAGDDNGLEELSGSGGEIGQVKRGTYPKKIGEAETSGLAVDSATGDLFVDAVGAIERYVFNASGAVVESGGAPCAVKPQVAKEVGCNPTESFGAGVLSDGAGVAVDSSNATVYAAEVADDKVVMFVLEPVSRPKVKNESVLDATGDSASFEAEVDPTGSGTEVRVEYGPCERVASCASSVYTQSSSSESVGSEFGFVLTEPLLVQGLSPQRAYHYRLVAENETSRKEGKPVLGEELVFTTQGSGAFTLLDERQWEMVTPPEKNGALFLPLGNPDSQIFTSKAAASGDAIVDEATQPVENESQGSGFFDQVLSTRGPSGWYSQTLSAPHDRSADVLVGVGGEYIGFSEDLGLGILQQLGQTTPLSPEASEATLYLRNNYLNGELGSPCKSSCYTPLVTSANTAPGTAFGAGEVEGGCPSEKAHCGPVFVAATPDAHHVLLGSEVRLTEEPVTAAKEGHSAYIYEWSAGEPSSKQLQPIAQLPASEGGGVVVPGEHESSRLLHFSLSNDGSYVFASGGNVYVHDPASDESFRLDVAQGVTEPAPGDAILLYASPDGSMVLFEDPEQLTSATGGGVYECRVAEVEGRQTCASLVLTNLVATGVESLPERPVGEELLGSSADGSYLYYLNEKDKLYVAHDDAGEWKQAYIATLAPELDMKSGDSKDWTTLLEYRTLRVSPNGEWLAFMSERSLTGYDNDDATTGLPDQEVYEYDAKTNKLVCASCDPTGARPNGTAYKEHEMLVGAESVWPIGTELAADIPPWTRYGTGGQVNYQSRYLSDNGRLFFNSYGGLVPDDVNGQWDVYEYEPEGVGSCASSVSSGSVVFRPARAFEAEGAKGEEGAGCVGLISSGISPEESAFLDASEGGGNVFFLTQAKLAPQDVDTAFDVYDAHECTSESPCLPPPAEPPAGCVSEASCKPSPTPQPSIFGLPASATFSGPGDVTPPPPATVNVTRKAVQCKRGLVKDKQDKCVRAKPRRRRVKAKKSIHRKGSR
jgi:hypothetical protein